ncbi:hypothetical protein GCM10023221_21080 [Luteimicrobium xylanilyticum]|uniref:Uncharacterized protein n=1 Tax=Luteimicrobium xylanilyticum TaxID=1133546 RepID=A0A5P9Q6G0_9MICO|nr:hypothetical protein [Luteimicrobium xylanilyticum]QFU96959.1 hypothetical protein KDY119_00451 [Luteimicrobium xylanilyticum]
MAYFEAKAAQQHVVASGLVPWSTVRATQFHDYVAATLAGYTHAGLTLVPPMRVQPVASSEVAAVVADVAQRPAARHVTTVTGPEVRELRDLARVWKGATGRRALLVPVAVALTVRDGGVISAIDVVRNPEKLRGVVAP